ncbi:MAG TPA: response regulator transcription factor [Gemmatimonadaceae bacterium]|nr:response regulator transcription factor [Gemmatimonadaceae bacterium]
MRLAATDREQPLDAPGLERLGAAAYLIGRDDDSTEALTRAHHAYHEAGDAEAAARCAFWVGFRLFTHGEQSRGSGWLARAHRILEDAQLADSVVHGYLLVPPAIGRLMNGDPLPALEAFDRAVAIAKRTGDRDLLVLARHGQGRGLIKMGRVAEGLVLLDEVMVAVTGGDASPVMVGDLYCSVIDACNEVFDLRRAREWTEALSEWCATQPDLVPGRGECAIHHVEIAQLRGDWPDALAEITRACEWFGERTDEPAAGAGFYRLAELRRLRGEFAEAEACYQRAHELGRDPQPGMALLRLSQGRSETAAAAIRGAMEQARREPRRSQMLAAAAEIMLAVGDVAAARAAADELSRSASVVGAPLLCATSAQATGAVLLAERQPAAALSALRDACAAWRELEAPYEAARVRVAIAAALRELNDKDTADMELTTAREIFRRLGAAPDLRRVESLMSARSNRTASDLTAREIQVLRLIATGKTNRAIAASLGISEKTVARHVSNLFIKLGLSTRAAATAYAFRHNLVAPSA